MGLSTTIIIFMALLKSGSKVFVDTSAWISLTVAQDSFHTECKEIYKLIKAYRCQLVTTDAVLSETLTRLRYDSGFYTVAQFYKTIEAAVRSGHLDLFWSSQEVFKKAWKIMEKFQDHSISFVDCLSAVHANDRKIEFMFTLDNDFVILGFTVLKGKGNRFKMT